MNEKKTREWGKPSKAGIEWKIRAKKRDTEKKSKQYSIRGSRVIPQRTTNRTQSSLSSEIGREPEFSGWYDRTMPRCRSCPVRGLHVHKENPISGVRRQCLMGTLLLLLLSGLYVQGTSSIAHCGRPKSASRSCEGGDPDAGTRNTAAVRRDLRYVLTLAVPKISISVKAGGCDNSLSTGTGLG
jgi:hypothetical protein